MIAGASPLRDLLLQVWATCEALVVPSSPEAVTFRELWRSELDRAYEASNAEVLDLLILNREVAALAPLPVAEETHRQALANTARLLARLGEPLPKASLAALEGPDEIVWLEWCRWWNQGRTGPNPTAGWSPRARTWSLVREGCALLSERSDVVRLALYSRPSAEVGLQNTPLSYIGRLARLMDVEQLLARGDYERAQRLAEQAGPDGERLAWQAWWSGEAKDMSEAERLAPRARYRAYKARRLAERLELLSFFPAAAYWRQEQKAWTELAVRVETVKEVHR